LRNSEPYRERLEIARGLQEPRDLIDLRHRRRGNDPGRAGGISIDFRDDNVRTLVVDHRAGAGGLGRIVLIDDARLVQTSCPRLVVRTDGIALDWVIPRPDLLALARIIHALTRLLAGGIAGLHVAGARDCSSSPVTGVYRAVVHKAS
jgi:hypothetical protein